MPQQKPIRNIDDLEDFLSDWGTELGMPDADDEDTYTSECPACDWIGPMIETVFKNGHFHCPACDHMFVPRD